MKTEFERASADEELYQHAPAPMAMGVNPADGMPQHINLGAMMAAPPLRLDTMVCMADTREFVIRNEWGEITHLFDPVSVGRAPDGSYRVPLHVVLGRNLARRAWPVRLFWNVLNWLFGHADGWHEVEPVRPACQHYARSLTDIGGDVERKFVQRVCLAQKTDNGEYVTLRDSMVLACEIRNPRDTVSEAQLDRGDAELIERATKKIDDQEVFDPTAELAALKSTGVGGIFSGKN